MDEHAQTAGDFLDGRHAKAAARIAELEAERDEWCAEARLLAGKLMERDAECIAERERREAAEELLRGACCPRPANRAPDDTTVAECIRRDECGCIYGGHFARYKD